ncbi:MAG: signal peptidase II [Deltaproteobacteria bacterium]|nr:signal peptidase II [Deltaproteobacteria bacterium]
MSYKYKILLILAPVIFILDQCTKYFVVKFIAIGDSIPVIPGFFDLIHVRNAGAAFGLFANLPENARVSFFFGISGVALCILIYVFRHLKAEDHYYAWPLSLVTGGVLGNFMDRIRYGNVVDFLSVHIQDKIIWGISMEWPAFNVADSAITVSMILLAAHTLKSPK